MKPEVVPVSRPPEKLSGFAPAIRLITQQHIAPSGARQVREALKLSPGLQLSQEISNEWAVISLVGNNMPADEALLLMDWPTADKPPTYGVLSGQQKFYQQARHPAKGAAGVQPPFLSQKVSVLRSMLCQKK